MSQHSHLLSYDWRGSQLPERGLAADAIERFSEPLQRARSNVLQRDLEAFARRKVPPELEPLDAGFVDLPDRLLDDYRVRRDQSSLGRTLAVARRLSETVDRVVVLGIGGSHMGPRALMQAFTHPYHNELARDERAGHPRMYFEGHNLDNEAYQGLLDLLGRGRRATTVDEAWGLVVISKSGGTLETAIGLRIFLDALRTACGGDLQLLGQRVVPVTGPVGKLREMAGALGCRDVLDVPEGVGGRFSILSAVGLFPAALLGMDVVALLEGAAAMTEHFRAAPPGDNRVLDYVGVCHLMETLRGATIRILSIWAQALELLGMWYDQLLAESLGKDERGATPLTVLNPRDLHSRAQQHQQGTRDKLITNLVVDRCRCDVIRVVRSEFDQDGLNRIAGRTVPDIMKAVVEGTDASLREDSRPTATIRIPQITEFFLGQLFQLLMLATVVEGRLLGINPYGQPGVEGYKRHMKRNLGLA